jgi:hypothetical protein
MSKPNIFTEPAHLLARTTEQSNGCLYWNGAKSDRGYGQVSIGNKVFLAHRVMMRLLEPMPFNKTIVMHKCDNPPCINPNHLRWGDLSENALDALSKNRMVIPRKAKLTATEVKEIRDLFSFGFSRYQIAVWYEISKYTVIQIIKRHTWTNI